jgi:5-(carboxyamino)imidazole ribonucleotide synthase
MAALPWNIECLILDPEPNCPAHALANKHIIGKLSDAAAIEALARISDVLTYEIEHIDVQALHMLADKGVKLIPHPAVLETIQSKAVQKQFYKAHGIPTPPFEVVQQPHHWLPVFDKYQWTEAAAKLATGGYDGKGVEMVTRAQVAAGNIPFSTTTLLEEKLDNPVELSVMVARDQWGSIVTWPVVEMVFDPQANLVTYLFCPANIDPDTAHTATELAISVVEALDGTGVFAVEMFLDKQGKLWVNETAPRPHNSGHHTIEACMTSQYEQLVRILTGLPMGETHLLKPAAMVNILGAPGFSGPYALANWEKLAALPGVFVHLYGKTESKPMRKLGHVTILNDTIHGLHQKVSLVREWAVVVPG